MKALKPFSIVEQASFKEYIKQLGYALPTRKTVRKYILQDYEVYKAELAHIRHVDFKSQSILHDHHMSFPGRDFTYCNFVIEFVSLPRPHTAERILAYLITFAESWQIQNKILSITADNGSNVSKAIEDFVKHLRDMHDVKSTSDASHIVCI